MLSSVDLDFEWFGTLRRVLISRIVITGRHIDDELKRSTLTRHLVLCLIGIMRRFSFRARKSTRARVRNHAREIDNKRGVQGDETGFTTDFAAFVRGITGGSTGGEYQSTRVRRIPLPFVVAT